MTTISSVADPITSHISALERALRGPRRVRRCMIAEAGAGLRDTAAAYQESGLGPEQAAERAVRDFGAVGEVAPLFQEELTARQGRMTAVLFAIVFPAMLFGWDLLWKSGLVTRKLTGDTPKAVSALAGVQDVLSAIVGVAAVLLVVTTFRRAVSPRRLTRAVGVTGFVGAVICGGTSIVMNVVGWHSTLVLLAHPAAWFAFSGSALVMALVIWQAVRALRIARVS